jgi:hypothetical protein
MNKTRTQPIQFFLVTRTIQHKRITKTGWVPRTIVSYWVVAGYSKEEVQQNLGWNGGINPNFELGTDVITIKKITGKKFIELYFGGFTGLRFVRWLQVHGLLGKRNVTVPVQTNLALLMMGPRRINYK